MRYSDYYKGGTTMRSNWVDVSYQHVELDSYVEFVNWLKDKGHNSYTRAYYEGTQTCGLVEVGVAPGHSDERKQILVKAAETFDMLG